MPLFDIQWLQGYSENNNIFNTFFFASTESETCMFENAQGVCLLPYEQWTASHVVQQ